MKGEELYSNRFSGIEPFYNGLALVSDFDYRKMIINECGKVIHLVN